MESSQLFEAFEAVAQAQKGIELLSSAALEAASSFQAASRELGNISAAYADSVNPPARATCCMTCRDYNGFTNDRGETLVCGLHPRGPQNPSRCSDKRGWTALHSTQGDCPSF